MRQWAQGAGGRKMVDSAVRNSEVGIQNFRNRPFCKKLEISDSVIQNCFEKIRKSDLAIFLNVGLGHLKLGIFW